MVMTYDEYLKKNKKKKKEEPKVVLGYSNKNNVNNSPKSTTNTQTLIDKYVAEQKAKKDIAPVRTTVTTPKKPEERTWFQAGAFSDGYDFGDVAKTITGTTADVGLGITKGVFNLAEGIVDLGRYGVSGVANVLGAKEYAKDVKKTAQENTTQKWFSPIEKKIDKNSLIGEKGDTISEGLGYVASMIATGGVGGAIGGAVSGGAKAVQIGATLGTTGVTFTSAMGSGMSEAYEGGASDEEAVTYGAISGIAEAGTELIFGGLGKSINAVGLNTGLSSADDMLAKKVSEIFKKQVSKNIAETGIKMGAEGTEEVIAGILQAVGQKVTYKSEEELMQIIEDQELLESFISGAVVSGIAQAPSVIKDTKAGRDYVTGYTQQEQQAIDKVVNERITEQERQGITLTKKEKNAIIEQTTKEFNEFKEKVKEIAPVKDDVRSQDIAPVKQAGQQDAPVNERQQNYVSEAKETDSVYRKNLNEDASKYANNSKRTHEFVNTLSNISEATGENIRLTNNTSEEMVARRNQLIERYAEKKGISVEEATAKLKDTVIDAYNTGDGITINVNSPKALNRLVGHEITHSLEKTNEYSKLEKIAIEYAKTKGEYNSRVEILESLYDGTNADINKELTADIVGDYLFTDQEFINNIQKKDRNLFQRIYDEIKHLIKLVTANTKEARQLEQLKHSFEKAMRENKSGKTNKVTVQETKSNSSVEVESNTQEKEETVQKVEEEYSISKDNKDRDLSEEQKEFFKDSKVRDEDGNLLTVYHGTRADFNVFDIGKSGDNYGGWSESGKGFYFTDDIKEAQRYAEDSASDGSEKIKEVYLNITNPFDTSEDYSSRLEEFQKEYDDIDETDLDRGSWLISWFKSNDVDINEALKKFGYDGIIDNGHYVTFESNQIKEVTNTSPTESDDIRYSLSSTDSEGKELSKEQVEFFKDSKVRDADGNLLIMYHGSVEDFNVFDKNKIRPIDYDAPFNGFWFSNDEKTSPAMRNAKTTKKVYLNITNPAPYNVYRKVEKQILEEAYNGGDAFRETSRSVNDELRYRLQDMGYDGILWENQPNIDWETYEKEGQYTYQTVRGNYYTVIKDGEYVDLYYGKNENEERWEHETTYFDIEDFEHSHRDIVWVAFEPNQIKNVDNTNPTDDKDIRYSLSMDNQGRELSKEQQEYFKDSKVRNENGNLVTVYHGTTEEINVFDKNRLGSNTGASSAKEGFFFTSSKQVAEAYSMYARPQYIRDLEKKYQDLEKIAQRTGSKEDWRARDEAYLEYEEAELEYGYGGRTDYENQKEVYLNITNPLVHDFAGLEYRDESYYDLIKQAKENGNDGVILKNTYDGYGEHDSWNNPRTDIYVAFESNQIKNVDNTTPTDSDDIRYSLSQAPVENNGYEASQNKELRYTLDSDKVIKIAKQLGISSSFLDANISGQSIYSAVRFIKRNSNVIDKFIQEKGLNYEKIMRPVDYSNLGERELNFIKDNEITVNKLATDENLLNEYLKAEKESLMSYDMSEDSINEYQNRYRDAYESQRKRVEAGDTSLENMERMLKKYERQFEHIRNNVTEVEDTVATSSIKDKLAEENGINDYVFNIIKPLLEEKNISREEMIEMAQDEFGTTDDFTVGAYMTPDGKLLNFGYGGYRDDHRGISSIGYDMQEFIDAGNIRMKPESNGVEFTEEPTKEQYGTLREYFDNANGEVYIDINKPGSNGRYYDSAEYKAGTSSSKIINDIKEYYRTGSFPKQSEYAEFLYSLSRTTDDIAPVKDADVFGRDIALQEAIAPLQEQVKELTKAITDLQENIAPASMDLVNEEGHRRLQEMTDEDAPVDEGLFTFLDNEVQVKKKQEIVNDIARDFNIKKTEARELYNKIYSIPEPTIEDIVKELEAYREIKFQEEDDYVKSIQDYIRGTRLDISEIKKQIPDYGNKYRMSNMGKGLILGNSGQKIDAFYQELSELYPNEFPATVTAEADQLELISDAMYKEKEFTYTDIIDDDELQILAERIYSDIGNHERYRHAQSGLYFLNKELKNMTPPGEADNDMPVASNTEQTEDIAPVGKKSFEEIAEKFLERKRAKQTDTATPKTENNTPRIEKSKYRNFRDTTQRLFVNEMVETDNLAKETGNLNIKYTGDMLNSVAGEIEGEIQIAQTDNEGHAIGKSLSELFAPAKEKGLYDAFNDYLEHYSNIDRHAQGKGSKTPLNVSQTLVKAYEKSYPEFKQWGKDVWKYGTNVRDNLIDAGIISEEHAEALGTMYPHYVPYMENREMSNYNPDLGEIKPKGVIKRAVGGAENLLPIEDALTKYTFGYKKAVRQNQFYQEIVKTLGPGVDVGADVRNDAIDFEDTLYKDETGNYLTAYVDGERISTRITDDLYTGLKNDLSNQIKGLEEKYALITEPVQKLSEIRRNLLTSWNPMFIIKNPIMDIQDALFNSKYTKDFMKNYPGAFIELGQAKSETARQFLTLYGSGNVMGEHSADGTVKNSKFLKGIQRANNVMELAPRYAEFKASLENGASIQEAMYNAREVTTNFSRGGTITKALNKNGFTFLNVSVQGFDKFIRNFGGENGAKGFTGALLKATLLGVAPALFNDLLFGGDDEDEEYEALPDYIKDNYYLIKTGEGEFIRIPKGRMLSVFGSAGRRTLEFMQGEEDAFEGFLKNANSQVGISNPLDSNILTPLIQAYGSENGEAWYGGDLVPSRLQKKAPEEQYDATTDKMSIWLGDKLKNIPIIGDKIASPYKLNYVLDQYSGGIGDIFLPFITEESTSDAEGLGMVLAPIKDQFTANSTSDNKYAGEIYDLSDKMDKMPEATKETDEYKVQDAYLYSVTSEMGKLYEERRKVQADKNLSKSEKYKKVQAIQKQINDLAKEGMENYQNVSKTDNYAIVGGREFNKYTTDDGTERWGSVFEDVLEDLNSLGMDLDEKSEYFRATKTISTIQDNYKNLLESASDEEQDILYAERKKEIINAVKEKNLTGEQKAYLYDKYYGNSDVVEAMVSLNVDIDSFLDYEAQDFTADKYANGKTIPNSKKRKVFEYINSMPIEFEQRLVLAKLQYPSYNEYNPTIIEYLNNSEMTYEQVETLLTKMDFKVDENGNIRW